MRSLHDVFPLESQSTQAAPPLAPATAVSRPLKRPNFSAGAYSQCGTKETQLGPAAGHQQKVGEAGAAHAAGHDRAHAAGRAGAVSGRRWPGRLIGGGSRLKVADWFE